MQLNKETEEALIDYIFEKDEHEILDKKYAGFENIILGLVKEGKVTIADTSENNIEEFFELFPFIEPVETDLYKLHKFKINIDKVIADSGFESYREKEISDQWKEIRGLEKEINTNHATIKNLEDMVISHWNEGFIRKEQNMKSKIHELKTSPQYFFDVVSGVKTFDVRKADRNFVFGDTLILKEYDLETGYTGREVIKEISYILTDSNFVKDGFVILGIS